MTTVPPPAGYAKDFLSILDLAHGDLDSLLALARQMKADRHLGTQAPTARSLSGMHVALLFEKPSLRTASTFEIAIRELGGDVLNLPSRFADGGREPLEDVARNLERWVKALVIRTFAQSRAIAMGGAAPRLHVINALTDEEHPCQALADAMTMQEQWGSCTGRTIAFVGDGNNVATSLAHVSSMLGVTMRIASPSGYELPDAVIDDARRVARDGADVTRFADASQAVAGADAVYTDVWTSMGEEGEAENRKRIFMPFQVNGTLMATAGPQAIFMHCLPAHRGEEVTHDVIEAPASVVFDQAENRLHTQKALLSILLGG
jgi:ornithine carbamoyltransferase